MFLFRVCMTYLGLLLRQSLSHELRHTSTENEFEVDFDKKARVEEFGSAVMSTTLVVGGFQLAVEDDFTREACDLIEDQFISRTDCTCNLSMLHSSMVQFGCKNTEFICNQHEYCSQPVYTGEVGYEKKGLSSDFCLNNLQKDGENFGNLCVAIDGSIDNNIRIKRCLAKVGKRKCNCNICGDGSGVRVDCSDIDNRLISRNCDVVNIVTNINEGGRQVKGFFPSFMS